MKEEPWHEREEAFLSKIEQQCNEYSEYFNKDYKYYHTLSSRFNIPILIVSSINALTAVSLNEFVGQKYVSIMNAILSAGTGILGSVQLYMKINEKMANALRSSILMKRLALKISRELSIERRRRTTEGPAFLQECFGEFNAALEQANPVEKRLRNFLIFKELPQKEKAMSFISLAAAAVSPKRGSFDDTSTLRGRLPRLAEPRAKTLWDQIRIGQRDADSLRGSESPPNLTDSIQEEESPRAQVAEP
mgnify:CR=1 FL=1